LRTEESKSPCGGGPASVFSSDSSVKRRLAARRHLRRQDPQRRQAHGVARGATAEVRAGHQPQDRQGARAGDTPSLLLLADEVIQ